MVAGWAGFNYWLKQYFLFSKSINIVYNVSTYIIKDINRIYIHLVIML